MKKSEWLIKALEHLDSLEPRELYKGLYGFFPEEYEEYVTRKNYQFEAQYIVAFLTERNVPYINVYDGDIQPPSKMFFHYLSELNNSGVDPNFFWEYGAEYLDLPEHNLRYLWVNGQGTEHFFQLIGV